MIVSALTPAGVPAGGVDTNYNHVSPRFGFTYDPFGKGRTVFHGGAGLFFDSISGNEWMLSQNFQPFAVRETGAFSHVVSLGDMCDVDLGDMLDYLAADPAVCSILLYVERVTSARPAPHAPSARAPPA